MPPWYSQEQGSFAERDDRTPAENDLPANWIPDKQAKPRAPNISPTPLEALLLPTRSSATTGLSKTKPLSKDPKMAINAIKDWKLEAADSRQVDVATPIMASWNICTRWLENLSASLPVKKEKILDDIAQAISK